MKKAAVNWNPSAARPKEVFMNCIRKAVERALTAAVNPSPGMLAAQEEWFARHPAIGGAAFVLVFTLALPLIAATGWLS